MIGVGLGLGMVRGGGGGFNPLDSRLSWAPPPQSNPTIIQLPQGFFKGANPSGTAWVNISGNGRANGPRVLDDDEDFILLPYNGISGHLARLPEAHLGGRWGRDLFRRLRCTACGRIGQAEVRLVWSLKGDPFATYGVIVGRE